MYGFEHIECFFTIEAASLKLHLNPEIFVIDASMDVLDILGSLANLKKNNPDIYLLLLINSTSADIVSEASKIGIFECVVKSDDDVMNLNLAIKRIVQTIELLKSQQTKPNSNFLKIFNFFF
jgi:DNA-binding NarL/FixJ family response regulator